MTLDISYRDDKKVRISKIHKDHESEELKKSKYKIDSSEMYIYDNQIDLDMFLNQMDPLRKKSLKPDFKEFCLRKKDFSRYAENYLLSKKKLINPLEECFFSQDGLNIYIGLKNPDDELNDNLCVVLTQLCRKYLKPGIMFISKEGIICKIDNCSYSENILKKFLEDFVKITEKTILKEI